ncbi:uncharacterized protein LY89DRAFT_728164 [Mollisia scopiformis]|uniref:Uncharacterized protein n=1 Tax=Mollisia scopiformis TaxID=149040 RepID=A0A194XTP4_MOLSC|nr:uncharacterized protein LY89DRAFT_728164 [Mollisia scopiformis]KUJ23414.1 hypothetical protein LY89DRAFT_728164 [Mollisia scopiformis]
MTRTSSSRSAVTRAASVSASKSKTKKTQEYNDHQADLTARYRAAKLLKKDPKFQLRSDKKKATKLVKFKDMAEKKAQAKRARLRATKAAKVEDEDEEETEEDDEEEVEDGEEAEEDEEDEEQENDPPLDYYTSFK